LDSRNSEYSSPSLLRGEELGSELLPSSLWLQQVALVENTGGGGSNNTSSKDMPEKLYFPLIASPFGEAKLERLLITLSLSCIS